jgi:nucleotide-binding universal stress UspA family protein
MNIVLALDGSDHSLVGRDLIAGLAWPANTTVHVVSAYRSPEGTLRPAVHHTLATLTATELRDRIRREVAGHVGPLTKAGLAVKVHVGRGRPARVVLDAARKTGADLIVTGSRGHSALRSMLLGSVANEVAANARRPVLIARRTTARRLLVATDGSESASSIPARIGPWAVFDGARADVVAVETAGDDPWGGPLSTQQAEATAERRRHADAMVEALGTIGIPAQAHVRSGDAAAEIVAAADELAADLVITGSRGLGTIRRLLLGSVARNVASYATASVLVVR